MRIVEPHDYGIMTGGEKLLVYQLLAPVAPRGKPATGWRLLEVPKIENCQVDWDVVLARGT